MATIDTRRLITRRDSVLDPLAPVEHKGALFITGIGPGLVAGTLMVFVLMILAAARGVGLFQPLFVIASTVLGPKAMEGGAGAALLGLFLHYLTSALLGGLFTRIFGRTTMKRTLGLGFFYGTFVWALVQFVLMPLLNPFAAAQLGTVWPFFLGHLGYGLMLAASVPVVKDVDAPKRAYIDPLHREVVP